MKKIKIHTKPKVKTTLPQHEQKARRTRAKTERPSVSRKRPHSKHAAHPADFHINPLILGR